MKKSLKKLKKNRFRLIMSIMSGAEIGVSLIVASAISNNASILGSVVALICGCSFTMITIYANEYFDKIWKLVTMFKITSILTAFSLLVYAI